MIFLIGACGAASPLHRGPLGAYVVAANASTTEGRYFPQFAFDGDGKTRWSSDFADDQWIENTFDRSVWIDSIVIRWETARAADYTVSVPDEAGRWNVIVTKRGGTGMEDVLLLNPAVRTEKVRIHCEKRATAWGSSIHEIMFHGSADGNPPAVNLVGWKAAPSPREAWERSIADRLLAESRQDPARSSELTDDRFLDLVERRAFAYFWWESDTVTGLTKDRGHNYASSEEWVVSSIAATGWALSACVIGVERGWVARDEGIERVRATLKTVADGPIRNVHGFFPHFVNMSTGEDEPGTEISTIDTVLFLSGMITAMEYFGDTVVSALATRIYKRVDWAWARDQDPRLVSMGVSANGKFIPYRWASAVDESPLVYILGLGSPTYPLDAESWYALERRPGSYDGYEYMTLPFAQTALYIYPTLWYDFRGKTDKSGLDFFENATNMSLGMRAYCLSEAEKFPGSYAPDRWGLGPADGLDDAYIVYGFPPGNPPMDGSLVVYAAAGSLPFLPNLSLATLRRLYDDHRDSWGKYGFPDSVNKSRGFVTRCVIGIDQGTVLLACENFRSGLLWKLFMRNSWIREATSRIGWKTRAVHGPAASIDLARSARWKAHRGDGSFALADIADVEWTDVAVPDRWENFGGAWDEYDGIGWIRTEFILSEEQRDAWKKSGSRITLTLGAVDDADQAYVNGVEVGRTPPGPDAYRMPRSYAVPFSILKSGANNVAIRGEDEGRGGGIWRGPIEIGPR